MELINKTHESITSNQRVDLSAFFKIESESCLYFSAGAKHQFGIAPGLFIHFQNDENKWYFYCNNDTDGFRLINRPGKNSSLICDASLVRLIMRRTHWGIGDKFEIKLTNAVLNGDHLLEIKFNKPL